MSKNNGKCQCRTVEHLVSDPQCPIEHDQELNEYNLVSRDKKSRYRLYYCFFCGGKLPASKRDSLFTEPSASEVKEVKNLLSKITSVLQVIRVFGEPDETEKAPKASSSKNGKVAVKYKRHHRYSTRWKTLDLTIREREDGSFDSAFTAKYHGSNVRPRIP